MEGSSDGGRTRGNSVVCPSAMVADQIWSRRSYRCCSNFGSEEKMIAEPHHVAGRLRNSDQGPHGRATRLVAWWMPEDNDATAFCAAARPRGIRAFRRTALREFGRVSVYISNTKRVPVASYPHCWRGVRRTGGLRRDSTCDPVCRGCSYSVQRNGGAERDHPARTLSKCV